MTVLAWVILFVVLFLVPFIFMIDYIDAKSKNKGFNSLKT